ncbi:MAG: hypothetical protein HGA97_08365 [Chlorobiaceae bacterium]|nr:hypothetical protein [Chlorobiaceae bacterium]
MKSETQSNPVECKRVNPFDWGRARLVPDIPEGLRLSIPGNQLQEPE